MHATNLFEGSYNFPFAILGMPVTNHDLAELIAKCINRIQKNKAENNVSYFSTINENLIGDCYGWLPSIVNHPELLSILRNSTFSNMEGYFLNSLARSFGTSIAESFTPKEFLHSLCRALGENEMGIFIVGSEEHTLRNFGINLHEKFKKLRLVGMSALPIFTQGEDLINACQRDALLIEQINSSNADVLLINLKGIKQKIWFERVHHLLSVPLVITMENSFDHPGSDKKTTFSLSNFLKLSWMSIPLIIFHTTNRFLGKYFSSKEFDYAKASRLFLSTHDSIAIIVLPPYLDTTNVPFMWQHFDEAANHDVVVFDFQKVCHIQPEGFFLLIKAWLQRIDANKEIYGFSPSWDVIGLMKLHRNWDLFKNTILDSAETLIARLRGQDKISFYDTFTQDENFVTISLLGNLDYQVEYPLYMEKIIPIIGQKNCCIDFSYCTYIDNSGFAFLVDLRKHLHSLQHNLIFSNINKSLKKQFELAGVTY